MLLPATEGGYIARSRTYVLGQSDCKERTLPPRLDRAGRPVSALLFRIPAREILVSEHKLGGTSLQSTSALDLHVRPYY